MIDKLTIDDFSACLNSPFELITDASSQHFVELIEATAHGSAAEGGRAPFSIVFRGPGEWAVEQGSYTFRHETLGELVLFIVPLGPGENGLLYEAVFN